MALTLRNQKEMEIDLHEQLYNNILVLSMQFPTTKEFNAHFNKVMFVKNNKAAFQHIIHFLLSVLDPVAFKQKVCWPILDNKMEVQFRNEVMKYVNEFPTLYEDSNVPLLMTSHLISPGGYRFTDFMHKLSQFVLLEYLKRDDTLSENLLLVTKADNDHTIATLQLENLNAMVDDNHISILLDQVEFNNKYDKIKQDAADITNQKHIIERTHLDVKFQYRECQERMKEELSNVNLLPYDEMVTNVDTKLEALQLTQVGYKYCSELVDVLSMKQNILKFDKKNKPTECVNLVEFLQMFLNSMKSKKHLAQYGKFIKFDDNLYVVREVVEGLTECYERYEKLNSELLFFISQLDEVISNFNHGDYFDDSGLAYKVRKVYESVPFVNIRITNLM